MVCRKDVISDRMCGICGSGICNFDSLGFDMVYVINRGAVFGDFIRGSLLFLWAQKYVYKS